MKFYVFDFDVNKKKYFWTSLQNTEEIRGKNNLHLITRGVVNLNSPINLKIPFGKEFDPILTNFYMPTIHKSVVELFEKFGLTGWKVSPAILHLSKKLINEYYFAMSITGEVGPIQWEKSQLLKRETQPGMFWPYRLGLFFDESTWDGSDFFMSTDTTGLIIITEKAKDVILKSGTKNARITPIAEVELGGGPIK